MVLFEDIVPRIEAKLREYAERLGDASFCLVRDLFGRVRVLGPEGSGEALDGFAAELTQALGPHGAKACCGSLRPI